MIGKGYDICHLNMVDICVGDIVEVSLLKAELQSGRKWVFIRAYVVSYERHVLGNLEIPFGNKFLPFSD